jgi:autotransporter-associated beta strand protein
MVSLMKNLLRLLAIVCVALELCVCSLHAVDDVAGSMFNLTNTPTAPNGAWSWFQDERAIVDASDPENPLLLVSSVSSAPNGDAESGDVDLLWRNLSTGAQGEFELHNRLERDDHDSAALFLRSDGRYLAMYSRHISDSLTRWRISVNPHDPTSWGPMQTLENGAGTTYNNIYHLVDDNGGAGRTYNFTRAANFDPVVQISSDEGSTWSSVGKLLTQGGGGDRPYLRYASDGKKIHFIATEEHPRDFLNSVYHGYIQDGVLYNSLGAVIDGNLFDSAGVSPTALTPVFSNGTSFNDTVMNRAWTISMKVDNTGNPVGIFSARANDSSADHRFFYARYDGAEWQVNEMARAGGFLYAAENDYTGLASIDPDNPNVVFMSSKIDPRSESMTTKYELYKGSTSDFGETWTWSAITENSTVDNIRPVVPAWNGQDTAVTWMRGTYTTYTDWNTQIVGLRLAETGPKSLLWQGDAQHSYWDINSTNNWNSGGGTIEVYREGDEVAFDDSSDSYEVHLQESVSPMGVAFNNSSMPYTLTGQGINGTGNLRVIGGGTVTLANGANNYAGETLVAKGTLALSESTSLGATSHIRVKNQGTLDVSGLTAGNFTLSDQDLTVAGNVMGTIHATNGSTVELVPTGAIHGNIVVADSLFSGAGLVNGNFVAEAGAAVAVGGDDISFQVTYGPAVYYDATSGAAGNTTLANGAVFNPPLNGVTGADNDWEQRTVFGSHGNIFEAGGEAPENAPPLKTTISGLVPGKSYEVSVLFWDANGDVEDWNIRAGMDATQMTFFANGTTSDAAELGATGAVLASTLSYSSAPTLFTEANRVLLSGMIGQAEASAGGQVQVFIDDMPSPIGANNRTWYDGIALREVIVPTELAIALVVDGDYTQHVDASLHLDIYSPSILDRLDISGNFSAAGSLVVSLASGAPSPALGDSFNIIEAASFSGNFDSYVLPALEMGLAWNVSKLCTTGELEVVHNVDLDNDGNVDGRDFLMIQRVMPELIPHWQLLYGKQLVTPMISLTIALPEPTTYSLIYIASASTAMMRLRSFLGMTF